MFQAHRTVLRGPRYKEIKRVTIRYVSYTYMSHVHLSDHVDVILGSECQVIADGLTIRGVIVHLGEPNKKR